jgi:hypothetical protein
MSDEQKSAEDEVFDQELSIDDLDAVAGGVDAAPLYAEGALKALSSGLSGLSARLNVKQDPDKWKTDNSNFCSSYDIRLIYGGGGFPNCAATVEDGSWCHKSDACVTIAVDYKGMIDCSKAWR